MGDIPARLEARLDRMTMPLSLEPKRTRSFIAFDPGRVNAGLAAGMCIGPAPTAAEFLSSFVNKVENRLDTAVNQSAWGEPHTGNRFFMPLASFHLDFDKCERDAWLHPAFEPEVKRKFADVVEAAILSATQVVMDGMERVQGNAHVDEDAGFLLVPPEDEPTRYEAPEADVCYPNAHMTRIAAGKNTPALRQTLRNVVTMMFRPEIAGMIWGFGQVPVVIEPQPEHALRQHANFRYRPHVIRMIQHAFELIITSVDYAMGFTSTRPFIYCIGKWGVKDAVMRWFPEDYASIDDIPEDETADMTTAQYNHRKQAVKNLIMFVCAAHKDGHGLLAYMKGKASKDEDETDAMALILRGHQVTMRTRPLTKADIEAHTETLDQSRQLDRMWAVVHTQRQAPAFTDTDKDFVKKAAPRKKKAPAKPKKATPSDFVVSEDDDEILPTKKKIVRRRARNDDDDEDTPAPKKPKRAAATPKAKKPKVLLSDLLE